jgi:hypothetical protein
MFAHECHPACDHAQDVEVRWTHHLGIPDLRPASGCTAATIVRNLPIVTRLKEVKAKHPFWKRGSRLNNIVIYVWLFEFPI